MSETQKPTTLKGWFFTPPRAHGDVIDGRAVSFLELFYDLVFVVLIAQISHTFASHISWLGLRDFTILFLLIWIAWVNGSSYHELHGGSDGRSRSYIFIQMALLAVLAVYIGHAADDPSDGRGFAIVYAILLAVVAAQWYSVRKYDTPEMAKLTLGAVTGIGVLVGLMAVSAIVESQEVRIWIWIGSITLTLGGLAFQVFNQDPGVREAGRVTESLVERFALFTIIVLGEVVVGVVEGLSEAHRDGNTIATGVTALVVGFGFWWNYFDLAGLRIPKESGVASGVWNFMHLPMWMAIAGAGAGMVSLVEHAGASRTPAATAWLVTGATALMMLSLAVITSTLPARPGSEMVKYTLFGGAVIALVLGAVRPSPIIIAVGLWTVLGGVWGEAVVRGLRAGRLPGEV